MDFGFWFSYYYKRIASYYFYVLVNVVERKRRKMNTIRQGIRGRVGNRLVI